MALIHCTSSKGWTTIHCNNCSTGEMYSFKQSCLDQDITELQNERVIIHKGSIVSFFFKAKVQKLCFNHALLKFNHEIKQVEKAHNYSHTFQVVLNLSLPVKPDLLEQGKCFSFSFYKN